MAVHIIEDAYAGSGPLVADRRLYTDASRTKLIEDGDDSAAFLVASGPGKAIPPHITAELGLEVDGKGRVKQRKDAKNKELKVDLDKDATPPKDDGTVGATIRAAGADDVLQMTVPQLKDLAKERGVPGYANMKKSELQAAIVEGGAMQQGGINPDQAAGADD
jgi:hypothetical protein